MASSAAPSIAERAEDDTAKEPSEYSEDFSEEGEEGEDGDDDVSSETSASALEEEALYANQPACGLSPRLVVRRGVETLLAADAGDSPDVAPGLKRVDTVVGFERSVGRVDPGTVVTPVSASASDALPPLSRITTLSGLPEVAAAEQAIATAHAGFAGGSSASTSDQAAPVGVASTQGGTPADPEALRMRRVDTMDLLTAGGLCDEPGGAAGESRPAKRSRAADTEG